MGDDDASAASQIMFQNYSHIVGISFFFWDHILTLDTEVRYLWKRRKFASSYSFFVIRYFAFASNVPGVVFLFYTIPDNTCLWWSLIYALAILLVQLLISIVMILRMYALYNRSKRLLWTLIVIGVILTGVSAWNAQGQKGAVITILPGCHPNFPSATAFHLAGSWAALFFFDTIIFGLTVYNGWTTRQRMGPQATMSFHTLILRDGAMYFAVMILANMANLLTFFTHTVILPGSLATFASCISITMMTRLMLNLHQHADRGILELTVDQTQPDASIILIQVHHRPQLSYESTGVY
ncbi:hypothetical protein DFH09DRAFT_1150158 [Mycena vulgaris]|nr:hypothetical protein DFH09DRAFT_1150158 [Mycena vulgaris]